MNIRYFARRVLPLVVAVGSSLLAVGLAVWPNRHGRYDASLAVLTATLIAIVWYTYLTYLMATREEPTYLALSLEYIHSHRALRPIISNPTTREVTVRIAFDVWVNKQWVDFGPVYQEWHLGEETEWEAG
jgi:hypothetical protein